jgi:predicted ATPase
MRPSGVITFLFTDIEGSTRRWEADPDTMRVALKAHNEIMLSAIDAHQGWLFKHTGDGVCAAFASPRAAVDAAIAAQRKLELPVRMGLATGEAESSGSDYSGAVLNRAARVMAVGHGGQILLDGATAGLLDRADLVDLGPQRLRDLTRRVALFQVTAAGLDSDFPPLKTLDAAGNLRLVATTFVGRDGEVGRVAATLRDHRLVTLTGVGGVGKTRLAIETAARVATRFPDGVWVIELAAVGDPAAVPDAVATVLGITQQPGMTMAESVAATLEGRSRLLIFDNCEHVLDAARDLIEVILARSGAVKILATSREGLRVADEQLWLVPSLDLTTGAESAAVRLFVQRAQAVAPALSVAEEGDAIGDICRRLDGIPLAIELAASRMQSMTAAEVRDRLDDRFRLLVGSRRGLERHQTLRHAVQWSYDLLDDGERALLNRCSVFAGGFDLAGASALGNSDDEFATLDLLDALVRKSLLVVRRSEGRTRFSMLETVRQFAEEQLAATSGAIAARNAHAAYFANREQEILDLWDSPRQGEAYTWFAGELTNLRAAFRWAADNADLDTAATIAVYATFLGGWVQQNEPFGWAEELIGAAKAVGHRRLAQLYVVAGECNRVGRYSDFFAYSDAALAAIASGDFDEVRDEFIAWIAGGYMTAGLPERCIILCRNAIATTPGGHAYSRTALAFGLTIAGEYEEAMKIAEGLMADVEAATNPEVVVGSLCVFGFTHHEAAPAQAYSALCHALDVARDTGNRQMATVLAISLGRLAAARGDSVDALDFLALAIRDYHDSGSFSLMPSPLAVLAAVFHRLGRYESAATISEFAATPLARAAYPEITTTIAQLREVLGDAVYESRGRAGSAMANAAMATYAFEQIELARAEVLR